MNVKKLSFAAAILFGVLLVAGCTDSSTENAPPQAAKGSTNLFETPAPPSSTPSQEPAKSDDPALIPAENEVFNEQVAGAAAMLNEAPTTDDRVDAIDQLAAYPTEESETLMARYLLNGKTIEERNAAAQGLGEVEKPTKETVNALLAALSDPSEEVQTSAAMTLQDIAERRLEENSPLRKAIRAGYKTALASRSLHEDVREQLEGYLEF